MAKAHADGRGQRPRQGLLQFQRRRLGRLGLRHLDPFLHQRHAGLAGLAGLKPVALGGKPGVTWMIHIEGNLLYLGWLWWWFYWSYCNLDDLGLIWGVSHIDAGNLETSVFCNAYKEKSWVKLLSSLCCKKMGPQSWAMIYLCMGKIP